MMFNPSQQDVRTFFCEVWRKHDEGDVLTPLEAIAAGWIARHPEYLTLLADRERALRADYSVERGETNPFLHLSMHLSISEQVSIDQPSGVRAAYQALIRKLDSEHDAQHAMMECLGEMLWIAQRNGTPPDGEIYLQHLKAKTAK